jgi:hypothetical protein
LRAAQLGHIAKCAVNVPVGFVVGHGIPQWCRNEMRRHGGPVASGFETPRRNDALRRRRRGPGLLCAAPRNGLADSCAQHEPTGETAFRGEFATQALKQWLADGIAAACDGGAS